MKQGWFKIHRQLIHSDMWLGEKFTRGQAWVDLIGLANHKDGFIRVRGNRVTVKRGQVGWSQVRLSKRWRWSRGKLKRFLNELETEQQIVQQKNLLTCVVTLVNYNLYQSLEQQTEQQTDDRKISRRYTNKNVKNGENENNTTSSSTNHIPTKDDFPVKESNYHSLCWCEICGVMITNIKRGASVDRIKDAKKAVVDHHYQEHSGET